MKRKIIYVDFIKKRRITFIHFIINRILTLLLVKFSIKNSSSPNITTSRVKRILN
jgi:hypothetical protein